jgi:hypothetical protein
MTAQQLPGDGQQGERVSQFADHLYLLMQEMTHAGKDHGEPKPVRGGDHIGIAD